MTEARLSHAGELLIVANPVVKEILDEFAQNEDLTQPVANRKSYRSDKLGFGIQGVVFGVKDTQLAEKVWFRGLKADYPEMHPNATFDRHLLIRDFWERERGETSKLYVPEHYAVVEHEDRSGAMLMERVNGVTAMEIVAASTSQVRDSSIAERLGVETDALPELVRKVGDLLRAESSFYQSLFKVVPLQDFDPATSGNLLIEFDPSLGDITRMTAIDF